MNNILSVPFASPLKTGSTDGTSNFELRRRTYTSLFTKIQPVQDSNKKKWIGGSSNTAASSVMEKRRSKEIGKGTLNLDSKPISYCNGNDYNLVQRRRMFTRSGGATVPAKCRGQVPEIQPEAEPELIVGTTINKDMTNDDYTYQFDPYDYYPDFFPNMNDFIDANIVQGDKNLADKNVASYWDDWGNDIFDDWGFFYLYDVQSGKYYFPIFYPQNEDDGVLTTQTFQAFGRTFTIIHGFSAQGIFKIDISVNDNNPFRFGFYGDMGFDSHGTHEGLQYNYSLGSTNMTLYYEHTKDIYQNTNGEYVNKNEQLYLYFVPKTIAENSSKTYNEYYNQRSPDDFFIVSNEVTNGLIVYFAKTNDVKYWIVNDLRNIQFY